MKFFAATATLVGLAAANSNATTTVGGDVVWTTEVFTAYTTYCPSSTTVIVNNKTLTYTTATTVTLTDCPCTVTKPHTGTDIPTNTVPAPPVNPGKPTGTPVNPTKSTGTGAVPTGPSSTATSPPQVGGAAAAVPFGAAALAALAML